MSILGFWSTPFFYYFNGCGLVGEFVKNEG